MIRHHDRFRIYSTSPELAGIIRPYRMRVPMPPNVTEDDMETFVQTKTAELRPVGGAVTVFSVAIYGIAFKSLEDMLLHFISVEGQYRI